MTDSTAGIVAFIRNLRGMDGVRSEVKDGKLYVLGDIRTAFVRRYPETQFTKVRDFAPILRDLFGAVKKVTGKVEIAGGWGSHWVFPYFDEVGPLEAPSPPPSEKDMEIASLKAEIATLKQRLSARSRLEIAG